SAIWEARREGLSIVRIGRRLDRHFVSVYGLLRRAGGYAPRSRRRSARALRAEEREEISRGLAAGCSLREVARRLGRNASTISRELERNGGPAAYRAAAADARAWECARRPQRCKLARAPRLRRWVARKLEQDWSPRQIAIGLRRAFPEDGRMRVSHETIYRTLFVQARGALKQELVAHLRRGRVMRQPRRAVAGTPSIVDGISIRQRPAEANERTVPGHWEGDLLMGGNSSQVGTLVERRSRFLMLVKLDGKDSQTVSKALARTIRRLPAELRRSLTWDRGSEMSAHKEFTVATDVQVYFCDPRSPWQRGSNENTNGLLRQYFPKGTDVSGYSQAALNKIARRLNERPRETLNWLTPHEALKAAVATTG
ncbi:MAG: IS30 family transposase, partial [Burkholderiales bacterium]|nr:IS30 family transposase [Burkholderiales bacterium]